MNKKDYSFTYIRYRFSNLMLIPICFFVLVLADYFEQMDNNIVKIIYNIVAVVVLILIYNRISNLIFRKNGKISIIDSKYVIFVLHTKVSDIQLSVI